ncbi:MAG: hypothetical protein NVSMB64_17070 [Candidatus Velthaea sp.]
MRFLRFIATVAFSTVVVLAIVDIFLRLTFPHFSRLQTDFSEPYLQRLIAADGKAAKVYVLGDSALWGYRLPAAEAATAILARRGWAVENLAFEGGSTANTYATVRALLGHGVRPATVIFNVNLKEFNVADSSYDTLHPAVKRLAWPWLTPSERGLLHRSAPETSDDTLDRILGRAWFLYGARSDIRDLLFGQPDAASAVRAVVNGISGEATRQTAQHLPTPERFVGTYDLAPLTSDNTEVIFLEKTVALLKGERIPAYAILTPTNHALLRDYIDVPDYRNQLTYVTRLLTRQNVHVLDYDGRFSAAEFIDNDHLTASGNVKLANLLERDVRR